MSGEAALDQLTQFIFHSASASAQSNNHSHKLLCKPKYGGGKREEGGERRQQIFPMKTVFICSRGSAFWGKKLQCLPENIKFI